MTQAASRQQQRLGILLPVSPSHHSVGLPGPAEAAKQVQVQGASLAQQAPSTGLCQVLGQSVLGQLRLQTCFLGLCSTRTAVAVRQAGQLRHLAWCLQYRQVASCRRLEAYRRLEQYRQACLV
jgi:hypothetical protein